MAKTKKKYDYRAVQAQKRNKQKAADAKVIARNKEIAQKYGKQIIIGVIAAVVLIIAIWLCCKWFVGPGGSIPNWFGTLRDVEENWVIANTGTSSSPKYFKFGEVTAPEGYTLTEGYNYGDNLVQSFTYQADDENAAVQLASYAGYAGTSAETGASYVPLYYGQEAEAKTATINGHEVHYCYLTFDTTTTTDSEGNSIEVPEEEHTGVALMYIYQDTVQDSSVQVSLQSREGLLSEAPTQKQMEAEMEKFLSALTVAE